MKTILHVSKYYFPDLGGIETVAMYLAEGMTEYRNIESIIGICDQLLGEEE